MVRLLKTLEFVEHISSGNLPVTKADVSQDAEFLALAGLWAGRDIALAKLRERAWPGRA